MSNLHPGWDPNLFKGQTVDTGCSVDIEFQASQRWRLANKEPVEKVGDRLLGIYRSAINSFLDGSRIDARNANLPYFVRRYKLPGVEMRYLKQNGLEQLRILVQPEAYGDTVPVTEDIDGDVIVVKHDFTGWPIPGYDRTTNPDIFGADNPYEFNYAEINAWPNQYQPFEKDLYYNEQQKGEDPDKDTDTGPWDQQYWQDCGSGSQIAPIKLKDKQYWEVEVKSLPTKVPSEQTYNIPDAPADNGSYIESEQWYSNNTFKKRKFPSQLNTFLSPAIGVISKEALVPKGSSYEEKTPTVMGLAPKGTPRATYVVRTSIIQGAVHYHGALYHIMTGDYTKGGYSTVVYETGQLTGTQTFGGDEFTANNGAIYEYLGKDDGTGNPITGVDGQIIAPKTGPAGGIPQLITVIDPNLTRYWSLDDYGGFIGGSPGPQAGQYIRGGVLMMKADVFTYLEYAPVKWMGGLWRHFGNSPGPELAYEAGMKRDTTYYYQDDLMAAGCTYFLIPNMNPDGSVSYTPSYAYSAVHGSSDYHLYEPPQIAVVGDIKPKIIDKTTPRMLGDTRLLKDNHGLNKDQNETPAGRYTTLCHGYLYTPNTKLDFGDMQEKDVFMFATDISEKDGTHNLYIGKNKVWYGPDGPIGKHFDKSQPTIQLDKEGEFYPCVSWRVGPVELHIKLAGAQSGAPPAGFEALRRNPILTIPIGLKDV